MAVVQAKLGQLNDIRIQLGLSTKSMSDLKFKTGKKQPGKDKKSVLLKEMESSDSDSSLIESDISEKDLAKETNFHNLSTIPIPNGEAPDTEGQIFRGLSQLKSVECSVFKSKSKITKSHHKPNHPPFNPMFLGFQNVPLPQPVMMYQPEYVAADDPPPEYSLPITSYSNAHKPDSKHSVTPVNRQPTIVAKPVVRDLQKELIQSNLIPSSVNRSKRASKKLAHDIAASVSKPVVACCVLKGAYGFFSNLTDHLKKLKTPTGNTIPLNVEFIKVKSYENDASTGKVKISLTEEELLGKDLLIVEDIVDTGATMVALIDMLKQYSPSSIKVVSLLLKKTSRSNDYVPDFVGFSIPDLFVVGYGLDYNEIFRDLQHIAKIIISLQMRNIISSKEVNPIEGVDIEVFPRLAPLKLPKMNRTWNKFNSQAKTSDLLLGNTNHKTNSKDVQEKSKFVTEKTFPQQPDGTLVIDMQLRERIRSAIRPTRSIDSLILPMFRLRNMVFTFNRYITIYMLVVALIQDLIYIGEKAWESNCAIVPPRLSSTVLLLWIFSILSSMLQTGQKRSLLHLIICWSVTSAVYALSAISGYLGIVKCLGCQDGDYLIVPLFYFLCICPFGLFTALFLDCHMHHDYSDFIQEDSGVKNLIFTNLDLHRQLRVAKVVPSTESIVSPLTKATQILVELQAESSEGEPLWDGINQILQFLNHDKLFEPDFLEQTGDTEVTDYLQDVLQTRKNTISVPMKRLTTAITQKNHAPRSHTASKILTLLETSSDPFFNVLDLEVTTGGHALYYICCAFFQEHDFEETLGINEAIFKSWIIKIENGYERNNSYHNSTHAADVSHSMHYFVTREKLREALTPEDFLACLIAAAGHDYMHPGYTNAFLVATQNPLALRYNDSSVLEHFHSASIAEIFLQPDYDLLGPLTTEQRLYIREMVISMILATDMGSHFEWLGKFKNKLSTNSINLENKNDKKMVLNIAIKCSDVNNLSKPLELSRMWTQLIMDEFFKQGDQEKSRGLTVSMFMDRTTTDIPKCQMGFIDYIVYPLYDAYSLFCPDVMGHLSNISQTKLYWKSITENQLPVERVTIPVFSVFPLRQRSRANIPEEDEEAETTKTPLKLTIQKRSFTQKPKEASKSFNEKQSKAKSNLLLDDTTSKSFNEKQNKSKPNLLVEDKAPSPQYSVRRRSVSHEAVN
ncbi:High affinity cAMP-specific 3',5'-cyclic phosphodiesterase 7A [Globomyces sp. JEL0801]|nr:High affinity cAMP-specific 3',5'-cyclic phosphodiesterase 7A [Globomyces sp. JEL0801]